MNATPPLERLVRQYGALSSADVARLDRAAIDLGVDILQLMETAGLQVARVAWRMIGRAPAAVHVVAGRGHNGGDGLVAARYLRSWGCPVTATVVADPEHLDEVMGRQYRAASGAGVTVTVADTRPAPPPAELVIDALLGTGLRNAARAESAAHIRHMVGPILSVDVPSGMDATTGAVLGDAVTADATVTLTACKQGFWQPSSRTHTGELFVADIGMPLPAWQRLGLAPPRLVRGASIRRIPVVR